jgi:hypothetical protein
MKKILAILLALSAIGMVISGCSKSEDAAPADTAGGTAGGTTTGG